MLNNWARSNTRQAVKMETELVLSVRALTVNIETRLQRFARSANALTSPLLSPQKMVLIM